MAGTPTAPLIVNVRGWLEGSYDDIALVKQLIEDEVPDNWSNFGWRFPHRQMTGHWYAFYGLELAVREIDWFVDQLRRLATLVASTTTPRITGLFLLSDEQDRTMQEVHVRGGDVLITPGDPKLAYLDG